MSASPSSPSQKLDWRASLCLVVVCLVGIRLAAPGIGNESAVSLDGDMPRYLMNGVFLTDLARDLPLAAPLEYAKQYYARYPALSLGAHPVLPAIAQVPFFALFGFSILSARLSVLFALVVGLIAWFALIRSMYDTASATWASLLLVTVPGFAALYRVVLSEPYTLTLIFVSLYMMDRYCTTERRGYVAGFVVAVVLSAYAKHLAVAMFPVYAFQLVRRFGPRILVTRRVLLAIAIIGISLVPLAVLTLHYSQFNVTMVTERVTLTDRVDRRSLSRATRWFLSGPFGMSIPLVIVAVLSAAAAAARREWKVLFFVVWVASIFVSLVTIGVANPRFVCYWIPAFAAAAALLPRVAGATPARRAVLSLVLVAITGSQLRAALADPASTDRGAIRLAGAGGYEEAAREVTDHRHGATVLYNAAVDTGYFAFFLRKHDADREMVLLRADKLFTTSRMGRLDFEKRIASRDEVLPILLKYGVGSVVVENRQYADGPLRWLQEVVQTGPFTLQREIPIVSTDRRLRNTSIAIYRYQGDPHVDPDAYLSINVPTMNEAIGVRLADLLRRRAPQSGATPK